MPRINRAIELLEQGQPIYYTGTEDRGFEGGLEAVQTWADYLDYDMEHDPFDVGRLRDFMRGAVQGGPTGSGHRTPAVIATLPMDGTDEAAIRANAWVIKQALASGIHGVVLCHAETPDAVRAFVESARYPHQHAGVGDGLGEGRRGHGGQDFAAEVWGISGDEYLRRADPWPLNPEGELLLGLKIENRRALANVEQSVSIPGIAFAEWGPADMGLSLGFPDDPDEPYPGPMRQARARVLAACRAANVAFLDVVRPDNVTRLIDEGVRVGWAGGPGGREAAELGRRYTKRALPW